MTARTRALLAGTLLALAATAAAPPAVALSCAHDPAATPEAIADGSYRTGDGTAFFARYDRVVVGTATATSSTVGSGPTTVVLDVTGVLGRATAPSQVAVSVPDDGANAGYRFEVGRSYFVPLLDVGPDGRPDHSFLCDPITELEPERFPALAALAAARGLPSAVPPAVDGPGADDEPAADPTATATPWAVGLLAVAGSGTAAAALVRRRRG